MPICILFAICGGMKLCSFASGFPIKSESWSAYRLLPNGSVPLREMMIGVGLGAMYGNPIGAIRRRTEFSVPRQ
jgi:hypothetical protein